jgi:hypothetical protein
MISKLNAFLNKFVGPNSAHVVDGLVAGGLTAAGAALESKSARDYAFHHPSVALAIALAPAVLVGLAAKFRKAAAAKAAAQASQPPK